MENLIRDKDGYNEELHKEITLLREELRLVRSENERLLAALNKESKDQSIQPADSPLK